MKPYLRMIILALCLAVAVPFHTASAGTAAGTVTHLSGPFAARKPDGSLKVLSITSTVEAGDLLITEKRTYARVKFLDNSEITLKPNTQFKVEEFGYSKEKPSGDKAVYNLVKGGLRAVTGQIGKRGDPDSYRMKTPTATIGVRGTTFTADYVEEERQADALPQPVLVAMASAPTASDAIPLLIAQAPRLPAGLYVFVLEGRIDLTTMGGTRTFSTGQFGHAPTSTLPPQVLGQNPGLSFTPPSSFSRPGPGGTGRGNTPPAGAHDCEVR